jgi:hypothetical protein
MFLKSSFRRKLLAALGILFLFGCIPQAVLAQGYWDLFCVSLTPNGYYWDQVNGGVGVLSDPLVSPDPDGNPVLDSSTPLGGVAYCFGGHDRGNGSLEEAQNYEDSFQLLGTSSYCLSVVLDTATTPHADTTCPSYGTISLSIQPSDGLGGWLAPIDVDWVKSPSDPNSMPVQTNLIWFDHDHCFALESDHQAAAIYGGGVKLPTAPGYKVSFSYYFATWDSYVVPEPGSTAMLLAMAAGGGLAYWRRRQGSPCSPAPLTHWQRRRSGQ